MSTSFEDSLSAIPLDAPPSENSMDLHDQLKSSFNDEISDGETASQRSISLSSAPPSPHPEGATFHDAEEDPYEAVTPVTLIRQAMQKRNTMNTMDTDLSSEHDGRSVFTGKLDDDESPVSSVAPSIKEPEEPQKPSTLPTLPPPPVRSTSKTESIASVASASTSYSRKARPESLIVPLKGPLILGIALVDFDHLVGPRIEFFRGDIFDDEEIAKILPFLALPDGAHLSSEDYSYFHLVPSTPNPKTVFGISCNRQIRANDLLVKDEEHVTRSIVQKAVVVLASEPVFGLIRDRLGVITRALFAQRDFSDMSILDDFHSSLENSLRSQLTESGLYMGTSLRELVHTFRQRTLVLLKALMLQKKIMFYGHPVEKLCTYQYSLVTLVPGLLQNLVDCGSPPLATRSQTLSRPTSLKTSDPKSMLAYIGLPLDLFGKDAFFQPYLPLQQLDMLKDTKSWLCGSTNSIVTQQKEVDILINIENGTMEFRDPKVERIAGLTATDRKWMDDIVQDVNASYDEDPTHQVGMHFKGSDDYLRQKFEDYITSALATVKYSSFITKGTNAGVIITDVGDPNSSNDFNPVWLAEFKKTTAYEVWERVTDPLLFDIVEAKHPCTDKPSVVTDISLRLTEGLQELKLDQSLAPARETISRTWSAAVEGVRGRWLPRNPSSETSGTAPASPNPSVSASSSIVEVSKSDAEPPARTPPDRRGSQASQGGLRPMSLAKPQPPSAPTPEPTRFSGWVGSFFASPKGAPASTPSSARQSTASLASSLSPIASSFMRRGSVPVDAQERAARTPSPMPEIPPRAGTGAGVEVVHESPEEPHVAPRNLDQTYGVGDAHHSSSPEAHADIHGLAHLAHPESHYAEAEQSDGEEHQYQSDEDAPADAGIAL